MQKITMLQKEMLFLKFFFFFNLFFSFTQAHAQTLRTDALVPVLDVCDQSKQFSVSIAKGSSPCTNGKLKIQVPEGFELQRGSVKVDNQDVTETYVSEQEMIVNLNIPAGPISQEINVTFYAKALCNIIGNVTKVPVVTYTLNGCNSAIGPMTSDAINIRYAVLRISVTPENFLGKVNDEVVRTVKIVNNGNGDISTFTIERNLGNGLSPISYDFSELTAQGWVIDYSNPSVILFSGKSLKSADSISFIEKVKIESCVLTPTKYQAYYGCTQKCTIDNVNGSATNIINLEVANAPKLEVKSTKLDLNCFNSYGKNTWSIKNTGKVATTEITFEINSLENINITDGAIFVGTNSVNVLPGSTSKNAKILLPALAPGMSIEVTFDQFYSATSLTPNMCEVAPDSFRTGQNSFSAAFSFTGACAEVTNSGVVKDDTIYNYAGQHIGEVDIYKGQSFDIDYLFHSFNIPFEQLKQGDKFAVIVELSAGLEISNFIFQGINSVSLGDNRYEIVFEYDSPFWPIGQNLAHAFSRIQFPVTLNCDTADLNNLWYKIGGELRKNGTCNPVVFKCNVTKLYGFCDGGPCSNGFENDKANLKRLNIGHKVDLLGKPDVAAVSINAELRNFIEGDILEISQLSKAIITDKVLSKVKFVVNKDSQYATTFIPNSGRILVNNQEIASNIIVTETSKAYIFEHTLSSPVQNGQNFVLSLQIKAGNSSEFGLKRFVTKSFLIDTDGTELSCKEPYTATGVYLPTKFEYNGGQKNFVDCNESTNAIKFEAKVLDFGFQDSFFKNEFRKIFIPNKATLTVPANLNISAVTVTIVGQSWLGNNNSFTFDGLNVTEGNYVLNLSNAIKAITEKTLGLGKGIDYLDEGFEILVSPVVALTQCEPTIDTKELKVSVNFDTTLVDGKATETKFIKAQDLTYNTGIGTLTMKVSNDFGFGKFNNDATEVSWIVKVESEGERNFNSVWFAKTDGDLIINSVVEVNNYSGETIIGTNISAVNEIYRLGNFESREAKYYLIKANVINCTVESLDLIGGYNCATATYPTSISSPSCKINPLTLTHDEIKNIIQTEVFDQFNGKTTKPDLCEDIWYTVQLHNGGDSKLNNLQISIPLDDAPGLEFKKFEFSSVYQANETIPTAFIQGTTYTVNDNVLKVSLPANVSLNTLERVRIKVYFKVASCDFRSGSKHIISTKAKNICDTEVLGKSNVATRRLIIEGGSDAFPELRNAPTTAESITIDPVLTAGGILRSVYNASVINSGEFNNNDAITDEYQVSLKLPDNWSIVGDPADYVTPANKLSFVEYNLERGYVYNVTSDIGVQEEISFNNVPLKYTFANETQLSCDHNFGIIKLMVYQNINVKSCFPSIDCSDKGIDQVLFEGVTEVKLPIVSALKIFPADQTIQVCNPTVTGGQPTLNDIVFADGTIVYHLDWYENLIEANKDLPANRLNPNTQLVNGRTYYVINRFVVNGECKSNIGEIKVQFKQNNLKGEVITICNDVNQTYQIKVSLSGGTTPYTPFGTGAPGTFDGNVWTSNPINSSTPFGNASAYEVTFTDNNNCTPLVIKGEAPICCSLVITCPVEKIVNCGSSIDPAVTGLPTIVKSCGLTSMTYTDSEMTLCVAGFKSFKRTFIITDSRGNVKECSQDIKIKDDITPRFNGALPADVTVSCSANVPAAITLTATDNCGSATVTFAEEIIKAVNACVNDYIVKRTYTATDLCGNSVVHVQTITVKDTLAPVFNGALPANVTVSCSAEIPAAATLAATDNCGSVTVSHTDLAIFDNNTCNNNYIVERTYTAVDACGNSVSHVQIITIKDTIAPRFEQNLPGNITVSCSAEIPNPIVLTAKDNCGTADVVFNEVKVDGSCTGNFKWLRTWTATDECGNSTVHSQTVTVEDKTAPLFTIEPQSKIVECDGSGNTEEFNTWLNSYAGAVAEDTCSTVKLSYLVEDTNTTCGRSGNIVVTFFATDSCGNFAFKQAVFIIKDTTPPVFIKPAKSIVVECGANDDALNAWLATNGGAIAVDSCSSDVTWTNNFASITKACGNTGSAEVTFTAIDACGNKSTTVATFTIVDTKAPVLNTPAQSVTVSCKSNTTEALHNWLTSRGGAVATDLCSEVEWTNDFDVLTEGCGMNAFAEVTFTATDLCGNKVETKATFTIEDKIAPVITVQPKNKIVELNVDRNAQDLQNWVDANLALVKATSCSNVSWTHSSLSLTDACGNTGSVEVTFTATDACNRTATTAATFTIIDKTAPAFSSLPIDKEVQCDGKGNRDDLNLWIANNGDAIATDFSSEVTWSHVITEGTLFGKVKVYYVDFTATDACGNAATKRAKFTTIDTVAPMITKPAVDKTVECDGHGNTAALNSWLSSFGGATATDVCSSVTWSHDFTELTKTCGSTGYAVVIFKVTDAFGNDNQTTARFTIIDTTEPVLITPAQSLTVSCTTNTTQALNNWLANRGGAVAADLCSEFEWTNDFVALTPGCGSTGTTEVTFTAADACGNKVETKATFTIEDKILPIITIQAKNKTVESDGNGNRQQLQQWLDSNAEAVATDSCSDVTWSHNFVQLVNGCGNTGSAEVTFTASDACGNSVSTIATFTIVDTTPPTILIQAQNKNVECDGQGNVVEFDSWLSRNGDAAIEIEKGLDQATWSYTIYSTVVTATTTTHTVDFKVVDLCNNPAYSRAVFKIYDTTPPEITIQASNKIVECDGNGNTNDLAAWLSSQAGADATDLCGSATWSHNFTGLTNNCGSTGAAEVTFTATDVSGNSSITKATFTIVDTTAPTFESNLPQDLTLECNVEIPKPELIRAIDLCSTATVTFNETINEGSCSGNYQILRTWTATDSCGNATSHVQTITIQDTTSPEFVGTLPATEVFMNCKDLNDAEVLKAIDNCGAVTVTSYDQRVDGDCEAKYDIIRTWIATDTCGNETSFTQTIHLSCAITIYNAVTADGDGNNDEFIIEGINCYPGNTVEIFNRWGVLVYETKNYNSNGNTFKGFADGRATISKGSKLPTGTYFYVVKYTYDLGNGQANPIEQAGYLHLETN